ncbi:glycosyltransferase family 4 protein [Alphaproteobacteria bacterium]|nr:glycosyltransferase family 4 protein [Alphaproteobacteria bacterium]
MNTKQISLLQVLPHLNSGGMVSGAIEVSNFLKKKGGNSIIVSSGGFREKEVLRNGGIFIDLPVDTKNPFSIYKNKKRLIKLIKKYNVNIIHARSRAPAWSAYWASKVSEIPFITTFHGTYGTENLFKKKYNSVMVKGDYVIAISKFIKMHIKKEYNKVDNVFVIPRGINENIFSPEKVSAERIISAAKKMKTDEFQKTILMPGRLTSWKGHEIAIRSLSLIKEHNIKLVILGDLQKRFKYKRYLENLVFHLGLNNKVLFLDETRDLPSFMMLADLVISCSTKPEAFGRTILEAQAMGRPVLAFNHGGSVELINENKNGILSPALDIDIFAENILKSLSLSMKDRKKISKESVEKVNSKYLTSMMCKKTISLYKSLILEKNEKNFSN